MQKNERKQELQRIIESVDEEKKLVVDRLIDEMIFLEDQMTELKKHPFLSVHPFNPAASKQTAAAIQYKRWHESYANDVRILISLLKTVDSTAEDELLKRLEEF